MWKKKIPDMDQYIFICVIIFAFFFGLYGFNHPDSKNIARKNRTTKETNVTVVKPIYARKQAVPFEYHTATPARIVTPETQNLPSYPTSSTYNINTNPTSYNPYSGSESPNSTPYNTPNTPGSN